MYRITIKFVTELKPTKYIAVNYNFTNPSMKGAIFMVPRPKLDGDFIYTLHHGPP